MSADALVRVAREQARLSPEQKKHFKACFDMFDTDKSGSIDVAEFGLVCRNLGMRPTKGELKDMIEELDDDNNGEIDFDEFCRAMAQKAEDSETEDIIRQAFHVFDKDGSGALSHDEMRDVLRHMGEKMTDEEINAIINAADTDGDGEVDIDEFMRLVLDKPY